MTKITEITQEVFDKLRESRNQVKVFKDIIGLQSKAKYFIGDTLVAIDNTKKFDVFKNTFAGKDIYYIIVEAMDKERAFAWTLYH